MENLNLAAGIGSNKKDEEALSSGLKTIIAVTVLIIISYFALIVWGNYLNGSISAVKEEYQRKHDAFINQNAKDAIDFQNRLVLAGDLSKKQRDTVMDLREVEKLAIPGVFINTYEYKDDSKIATLECYADNFDLVAKQILSFKSSNYFSVVSAGKSVFDLEKKKAIFSISLKVN